MQPPWGLAARPLPPLCLGAAHREAAVQGKAPQVVAVLAAARTQEAARIQAAEGLAAAKTRVVALLGPARLQHRVLLQGLQQGPHQAQQQALQA